MNGNHDNGLLDDGPPFDPVDRQNACPNCGEVECDELIWLDDERVECQGCRTVYKPGAKDAPPA